jgi:tetratricopeptide (TPR) repeat protein
MMTVSRKQTPRCAMCWAVALAACVAGMPVARAQESPAPAEPLPAAPEATPVAAPAAMPPAAPGATGESLDLPARSPSHTPGGMPEKPWNRGVPMETRLRARALYHEGNSYLNIPLFAQAAEKYQEALALYPHPAIYFNLALAQLNLVQPVESYQSFARALEHGPGPLGEAHYRRGLQYVERLEQQLGRIEVTCDQPGAAVTMDGRPLFTGPGRWQGVVVPGEHQILASADGFIPATRRVVVSAGERGAIALMLQRPERTETERYLPAWIPWASLGVGAAVLGMGNYMQRRADRASDAFNRAFQGECPRGCEPDDAPEIQRGLDDAQSQRRNAVRLYVAGGAIVTLGAALLYINRERVVRREAREDELAVTPMFGPRTVGVHAWIRF